MTARLGQQKADRKQKTRKQIKIESFSLKNEDRKYGKEDRKDKMYKTAALNSRGGCFELARGCFELCFELAGGCFELARSHRNVYIIANEERGKLRETK